MLNEMLRIYGHNTTTSVNSVSMKDYQNNNTDHSNHKHFAGLFPSRTQLKNHNVSAETSSILRRLSPEDGRSFFQNVIF
jgi:hypothetical protein